jgi:hypothetical protein
MQNSKDNVRKAASFLEKIISLWEQQHKIQIKIKDNSLKKVNVLISQLRAHFLHY